MSLVRVVTAAGDMDHENILAESLGYRTDVELVLRCLDRVELLAAIRGANIDALILVGSVEWFDRQTAHEATAHDVTVVVLSDENPSVGLSTVLAPDSHLEDIVEACRGRAAPAEVIADPVGRAGRLTGVWGPKGSPGRTRIATELAFTLQSTGIDPVLLDADPYGGGVVQTLGIVEELPSVVWAALMAAKGELDRGQLSDNLRRIDKGPVVVPGLPRADLWADVSEFGFSELLGVCRNFFPHTVIDAGFCLEPSPTPFTDGSEGRNRMARRALMEADRVVAVCDASPIGLKNFLWAFDELRSLLDPEKVIVVANKVEPGSEREVARLLAKHAGKRPVAYFPNEPRAVGLALEEGTAVSRLKIGSEMRAAAEALAISVGARLTSRGVLTRLGARR